VARTILRHGAKLRPWVDARGLDAVLLADSFPELLDVEPPPGIQLPELLQIFSTAQDYFAEGAAARPFAKSPAPSRANRTIDLDALRDEVNRSAAGRVETSRLRRVRRDAVELVKETDARKRYVAKIEFVDAVEPHAFADAIAFLVGRITQRTPQRVAHRRADRVRIRELYEATGNLADPRHAEIELSTEGGLYVKELVSGDDGRTEPSLAGRLGVAAAVTALDVVDVASSDFPDDAVDIAERFP